ncbi:MAG: homocysteine S-methyltransferase family protein, partial [Pseudomonadota bacterium]
MSDVVLMDGGMGQELIRRAKSEPTPAWSAQVMDLEPNLVKDIHLEYIAAGARALTINTYSVTRTRLEAVDKVDRFEALQHKACELALEARAESGEDVAITGCLSPFAWSYRPGLNPGVDEMLPVYREIARIQAPYVDVILCETMGSGEEALAAATAAAETGKPVWVAWTLKDDGSHLVRSGETLTQANAKLADLPLAVRMTNCARPESIDGGFAELLALGGPVGAYANGFTGIKDYFTAGTTVAGLEARADLGPDAYADFALRWVSEGATLVGGCCEVGP